MSGVSRRALDENSVSPAKLIESLRENKYFYGRWYGPQPIVTNIDGVGPTAVAVADNSINTVTFANFLGGTMNASQCLFGARASDLALWQNATQDFISVNPEPAINEGVEYVFGGAQTAANPLGTTIGSQTARNRGNKLIRVVHSFQSLAGVEEMAVGFRKAENRNAVIDNYDEMAVVNCQYDAPDVKVRLETILNGGATATTETGLTLAQSTDIDVEVRLQGRKVLFFIDGVEKQPANGPFYFDQGEVVIPFIHYQCTGAASSEFYWRRLWVGDVDAHDESLQF